MGNEACGVGSANTHYVKRYRTNTPWRRWLDAPWHAPANLAGHSATSPRHLFRRGLGGVAVGGDSRGLRTPPWNDGHPRAVPRSSTKHLQRPIAPPAACGQLQGWQEVGEGSSWTWLEDGSVRPSPVPAALSALLRLRHEQICEGMQNFKSGAARLHPQDPSPRATILGEWQ